MKQVPTFYEQTDFLTEDETLAQWHHRCHPAKPRSRFADRLAIACVLVALWVGPVVGLYALGSYLAATP